MQTNITLIRAWVMCAAALAIISGILHLTIGLNNDTMTLLHQTQKMLAGGRPYIDYIDVNPPLVNLFFSLPVLLAHLLGVKLYVALNLFALTVTTLSLGICAAILRTASTHPAMRYFILSSLAVALLFISFMHQLFADREWLLMTLIMPLMLLFSPLVERARAPAAWRNSAAVLAALGFALKPYTVPIYLMALAYRQCCEQPRPRLWREAEHFIIGGIGIAYIAVVLIFFREYIFTFLPIASETYGVIGWDWNSKLSIIQNQLVGEYAATALAALFLLLMVAPSYYTSAISYLGFVLLGTIASYSLSAGWYYTQYPFMVVGFLITVAAGSRLVAACALAKPGIAQRFLLLFVCGGLLAGLWNFYGRPVLQQVSMDVSMMKSTGHTINASTMHPPAWEKIEPHLKTHPRFLLIGINLWAPSLLVEGENYESVGRFDYLWPLPGIVMLSRNPQERKEYQSLAEWFSETIAADIETHQPALVINDVSPYQRGLPASYDALKLLAENPRFATAWENYTLAGSIDECSQAASANCAYQLYYRR